MKSFVIYKNKCELTTRVKDKNLSVRLIASKVIGFSDNQKCEAVERSEAGEFEVSKIRGWLVGDILNI